MWKTFPGCICSKQILIRNGYENIHSLLNINKDKLDRLEIEVEKNREIINELKCDHSKIYDTQPKFKILLGHRSLIIQWCEELSKCHNSRNESELINNPAFSKILTEMVRSAVTNQKKEPNARRFSKLLMDFSLYLYIMAGKACYEVISFNLPIPKANTISMYNCLILCYK